MARAVFTDGNTAVGSTDLHIQLRITDGITYLLIGAACSEHRECAGKRNLSCCGEACCDAGHIALCDTAVDMSVRKLLLEHACLGGICQVRIQDDHVVIFLAKFNQSTAVACPGSDLLYF